MRCESVEPDIVVVGCGSGFTAGLNAGNGCCGTGTLCNYGFHHVTENECDALVENLRFLRTGGQQQVAVSIQYLSVCDGGLTGTAVGDGRISLGHFNWFYTLGQTAQCQCCGVFVVVLSISVQGRDTELLNQICRIGGSYLQENLYGAHVRGELHRSSHGNASLVTTVGVGRPGFALEGDLLIHDGGTGGHVITVVLGALGIVVVVGIGVFFTLLQIVIALLEGSTVYRQRFDGGTRLPCA